MTDGWMYFCGVRLGCSAEVFATSGTGVLTWFEPAVMYDSLFEIFTLKFVVGVLVLAFLGSWIMVDSSALDQRFFEDLLDSPVFKGLGLSSVA